jgi:DNA-binding GntR family transcriptional regulator
VTTPPIPAFEARRPVSDLDYVYAALKQSCMNGEFTPGQKVTLPQLAEAFGTSQMPIREATNRLIAAKAMEAPPRRSLRIPEATLERLDELLPLRLLLEGEATRLAAAQGAALADALTEINAEMPRHAAAEDLKAYLNANQRFHFTLYAAAGNADLLDMIELLWMRYGPLMSTVRSGVLSRTGANHHQAVINAIRVGNAEAAKDAISADLTDAAAHIRDALMAAAK